MIHLICELVLQDVSLYAETVDGIVGVARSVDGSKYQVRQQNSLPDCVTVLGVITVSFLSTTLAPSHLHKFSLVIMLCYTF